MPNPVQHSELYDKYELGGVKSPGVVTLSGLARGQKWDIKEGDGEDGASTTAKGSKPAQFTASHYLVYDGAGVDEFAEWDAFLPILRETQSGKKARDFFHPDASELGVSAVVVEDIGQKVHDGKGGATVAVKFLEYKPPKPKQASPKPPPPYQEKPFVEPYDPNQDAKDELAALLNEAQAP